MLERCKKTYGDKDITVYCDDTCQSYPLDSLAFDIALDEAVLNGAGLNEDSEVIE